MTVRMPEHIDRVEELPADVSLMLRAHMELRCLSREVIPVLRQVETRDGLPEEQLGAAMAYLEVMWMEARSRAVETDDAHRELLAARADEAPLESHDADLHGGACRYYNAVKVLRDTVCTRILCALSAEESGLWAPAELGGAYGA